MKGLFGVCYFSWVFLDVRREKNWISIRGKVMFMWGRVGFWYELVVIWMLRIEKYYYSIYIWISFINEFKFVFYFICFIEYNVVIYENRIFFFNKIYDCIYKIDELEFDLLY